jgi:hypothetical protein
MSNLKQAARALAERGFRVFPLRAKSKEPATGGWREVATNNARAINAWWDKHPDHNIGIALTPNEIAIDIDPRNGGLDSLEALVRDLGEPPPEPLAIQVSGRGDGGEHWIYRGGFDGLRVTGKLGPGIDIKRHGGYLVGAGSVHPDTGGVYTINYGSGFQSGTLTHDGALGRRIFRGLVAIYSPTDTAVDDEQWAEILDALGHIPAHARETWINVGMALHSTGHEDALAAWDDWSATTNAGNYQEGACERAWASFKTREQA